MANCGCGQIRASNARLALYCDNFQRIIVARDLKIRAPPNFCLRGVVNIVSKYLLHRASATAIALKRIGC